MHLADDAALGVEEDQPGSGEFLDAEQVEFLAQLAVVALLGFLELAGTRRDLSGEEGRAVDALQLLVLLVALPVRAGDREQLERLDFVVDGTCGPRQKSMNCGPERVFGEDLAGVLVDQLALHGLAHRLVLLEALRLLGTACARRADRCFWISHIFASIFSRSSGVNGVSRWKS